MKQSFIVAALAAYAAAIDSQDKWSLSVAEVEDKVHKDIDLLNTQQDSIISFSEFKAYVHELFGGLDKAPWKRDSHNALMIYKLMDLNRNKEVDLEEYKLFTRMFFGPAPPDDMGDDTDLRKKFAAYMTYCDVDKDDYLSQSEFNAAMATLDFEIDMIDTIWDNITQVRALTSDGRASRRAVQAEFEAYHNF